MIKNISHGCRVFTVTVLLALTFYFSESVLLSYIIFTALIAFFIKDIDLIGELKKPLPIKKTLLLVPMFLLLSFCLSKLFPTDKSVIREMTPLSVFLSVFLAPFYEEIFFRKLLTKGLTSTSAPIFSALIFGLFHGIDGFPSAFVAGLALYFMYKSSGGIKLGVIAHLLNNAFALIFI